MVRSSHKDLLAGGRVDEAVDEAGGADLLGEVVVGVEGSVGRRSP